jgi:pimeloyl-ACP methyl ester carboxylesterase
MPTSDSRDVHRWGGAMTKWLVAVVAVALASASCSSDDGDTESKAAAPAKFESGPCPETPVPVAALADARCGVLVVPENRAEDNGRRIRLPVAILPATSSTPAPDPAVHLTGGPGNDGILFADVLVGVNANRDRDVILMSVRGTATSEPSLVCPESEEHDQKSLGLVYDAPSTGQRQVDALRRCRDRIVAEEKGIDLSAYNSTEAAADYADLRKALGIKEWNVFGHSYGTNLALALVREHPEGIRTLLLDGVSPPSTASPVAWTWKSAKEAYDAVFRACAEQPACAARYPQLDERFTDLVNQLEANPVRTTGTLPDGRSTEVVIDGGVLANWMLLAMHHAADIPQRLDELANGQPEKIADEWIGRKAIIPDARGTFSHGAHYGVICSEWVPYTSASEELDEVRQALPGFPDSVLAQGPQLPFMRESCGDAWKVAKAPASVREIPRTEIPTLVMSGTFDAQTGAQWGDLVAGELPNSINVKFPGIAHGPFVNPASQPCGSDVMLSFWKTPTAPDTACVSSMQVPTFVIG